MKEEDRYPERVPKREETGITPYGIWGRLERMHMEMNRLFEEALSPFRDGNFFSPVTHSVKEEGENMLESFNGPKDYVSYDNLAPMLEKCRAL